MDEIKSKPKSKKFTAKQERASLLLHIAVKVDAWIKQIEERHTGAVSVNRSDLVNFFIDKQPDILSKDVIEKIKDAYFDEVRFAQWALQQVKESKKKGESLSLKDILNLTKAVDSEIAKKPKKVKSTESKALVVEKTTLDQALLPQNSSNKTL